MSRGFAVPVAAPAAMAMDLQSRGAEAPPPRIDVDPGEVEVYDSVEVTFALGP